MKIGDAFGTDGDGLAGGAKGSRDRRLMIALRDAEDLGARTEPRIRQTPERDST